jgi:hypothetical protein
MWMLNAPTDRQFKAHTAAHGNVSRHFHDSRPAGLWMVRPRKVAANRSDARQIANDTRLPLASPLTVIMVVQRTWDSRHEYHVPGDSNRCGPVAALKDYEWCPLTADGDLAPEPQDL